jgi:hypothetical protein
MSKKKKGNSHKIEKGTRKIIEGISDLIKKTDSGEFKLKCKKKDAKKILRTCAHWRINKNKTLPAVVPCKDDASKWQCRICGKRFPINTYSPEEAKERCEEFLEIVNQCFFYSVKMGGDESDTKTFETLKRMVPRFIKIYNNSMKQLRKKQLADDSKHGLEGDFNSFNIYSHLNFRV